VLHVFLLNHHLSSILYHFLTIARAIESQCYVIAAAQYGKHNDKRESYGHSLVIDPWGQIVADAGGYDGPGTMKTRTTTHHNDMIEISSDMISTPSVLMCEIDLHHLHTIRQRMPIQMHRDHASFS
jgi:predicted amidohydrolase